MTRVLWIMLGWVGALATISCNSFTSLDSVIKPDTDTGVGMDTGGGFDMAMSDAVTGDADSADMGAAVYTPIDSTLLFRRDNSCNSPALSQHITVATANLSSSARPVGFSIALDSSGSGFVRWRSGNESRGAAVTMNVMESSYSTGLGFWAVYTNVIDTRVARTDVGQLNLNFFSGALTECSQGVFLRGENGAQEFLSTIENSTVFQTACPQEQDFALGTAGGFNPFNPDQAFGFFYAASFRGGDLRSWNLSDPIENNATTTVETNGIPSYSEPFVESTTGALIGFGSEDQEHFLLWNTISGVQAVESGFQGVPGKIALLHLTSEHYVLAVVEEEWIALRRFEHRVDEHYQSEIIWLNDDLRISIDTDVHFVELAAMPGGFTVFYDQGTQWTFQPVFMVESTPAERLVLSEAKINHVYDVEITYADMDFTTTAIGCDLVVSMTAGYHDGTGYFTNFEGGAITGFYGQSQSQP